MSPGGPRLRPARIDDAAELLDSPLQDPAVYEHSLSQVAAVNRWLGGTRGLLRRLAALIPAGGAASILDVATGSADVPLAIARWAARRGREVRIVASDIHPLALALARRRVADVAGVTTAAADALQLPFPDRSFDIAIHVLALHHFDAAGRVRVLRELARVSRRAVLVSELERSWPNYFGARLLAATVWRTNPITRHDGPLSVLRAFTATELGVIARRAGLAGAHVRHDPFERLLLEWRRGSPEPPAAPDGFAERTP